MLAVFSCVLIALSGYLAGHHAGSRIGGGLEADALVLASYQVDSDQGVGGSSQRIERTDMGAHPVLASLESRFGEMQAQVIELESLACRMLRVADMLDGEFGFCNPEAMASAQADTAGDWPLIGSSWLQLKSDSDLLTSRLAHISSQLEVLDSIFLARRAVTQRWPSAAILKTGRLSSPFGPRRDPLSGRVAMHEGIDLAAPAGSPIMAMADGIVSFSGRNGGYGQMIELDHGSGYRSRYGHNRENLVSVGSRVRKGEAIASLGSSGKTTGPHVHVELLYNGTPIDPMFLITQPVKPD